MINFGPFFSQAADWIHSQADMVLFVKVSSIILFTMIFIASIFSERMKNSEAVFLC